MTHFEKLWWAYVVIFVMVCLSAYFSASEIAFNTANKMRLRRAADEGSKTARTAYRIAENFTLSLSAILVGNNLANIAVSTCTTLIVLGLFAPELAGAASAIATVLVRHRGARGGDPHPCADRAGQPHCADRDGASLRASQDVGQGPRGHRPDCD